MFVTDIIYTIAVMTKDGPRSGFVPFDTDDSPEKQEAVLIFSNEQNAERWRDYRIIQCPEEAWRTVWAIPADHKAWIDHLASLIEWAVLDPELDRPHSGTLITIEQIKEQIRLASS